MHDSISRRELKGRYRAGEDSPTRCSELNEDSFLADSQRGVFAVADGNVASNIVSLDGVGLAQGLADKGYLFTDRPAYRAGQMVHVRGIVRRAEGDAYTIDKGKKYKLKRQSPVVELRSSFGTRQVFTLTEPLRINDGEFLALTIPTWAPSFAINLSGKRNVWRASRGKGKCTSRNDIKASKPQQKTGTTRQYGCDYKTARLLYWGYYVPR